MTEVASPPSLAAPALAALPGVRHGFFGRRGGVSKGIYASLNISWGSKDDRAAVAENQARIARALGLAPERMIRLHQVHSARAVVAEEPWGVDARPEADAVVTRTPDLALGISTADCAPVLFADAAAGVIGAAHAESPANAALFRDGPRGSDRSYFDLQAYVTRRLARAGVRRIDALQICTFTDADDWFSHRRSVKRAEGDYGCNLSAITL